MNVKRKTTLDKKKMSQDFIGLVFTVIRSTRKEK